MCDMCPKSAPMGKKVCCKLGQSLKLAEKCDKAASANPRRLVAHVAPKETKDEETDASLNESDLWYGNVIRATIVEVDPITDGPVVRVETFYKPPWHRFLFNRHALRRIPKALDLSRARHQQDSVHSSEHPFENAATTQTAAGAVLKVLWRFGQPALELLNTTRKRISVPVSAVTSSGLALQPRRVVAMTDLLVIHHIGLQTGDSLQALNNKPPPNKIMVDRAISAVLLDTMSTWDSHNNRRQFRCANCGALENAEDEENLTKSTQTESCSYVSNLDRTVLAERLNMYSKMIAQQMSEVKTKSSTTSGEYFVRPGRRGHSVPHPWTTSSTSGKTASSIMMTTSPTSIHSLMETMESFDSDKSVGPQVSTDSCDEGSDQTPLVATSCTESSSLEKILAAKKVFQHVDDLSEDDSFEQSLTDLESVWTTSSITSYEDCPSRPNSLGTKYCPSVPHMPTTKSMSSWQINILKRLRAGDSGPTTSTSPTKY